MRIISVALMLVIVSLASAQVELKVTREPVCGGSISPMQCGQFVEYLCTLVPGMWAEKLDDTGFEGLSPYKYSYLKETDFREKAWYPCGAVNRGTFELDKENKVGGDSAERIVVGEGPPASVGVAQDGIWARGGEGMRFSVWLRAAGGAGKVRVKLAREGKTFCETEFEAGAEWKKFSTSFSPSEEVADGTLSIEFRGPGTIWIDNASLMPVETIGGWRVDVVKALRELKPAVIRFGGSAVEGGELGDLKWMELIGDVDHRRPFRAWGGLQPTGAGLEEFVQLCRAVGAEPLICVRFSGRTPKDGADEVEYFDGAVDTPMGALRAKSGHAEPYGVKLWQVGNEVGGAEYDARAGDFARAMKKVDPTIQVASSFPSEKVIADAGDVFDFICPHQYTPDLAGEERDLIHLGEVIRAKSPAGRADKIKIAVTEWNTTAGDWGPGRAGLWTLDNALKCARYQNLLHRHCDLVTIANRSNLTNSFCSGILQTDKRERMYLTPTFYTQSLYSHYAEARPMKVSGDAKGLDVSATSSADGKRVAVFVVNESANAVNATLDLSAFGFGAGAAEVKTLADRERVGQPDVTNGFADPERVGVRGASAAIVEGKVSVELPAWSLTVVRVPVTASVGE